MEQQKEVAGANQENRDEMSPGTKPKEWKYVSFDSEFHQKAALELWVKKLFLILIPASYVKNS